MKKGFILLSGMILLMSMVLLAGCSKKNAGTAADETQGNEVPKGAEVTQGAQETADDGASGDAAAGEAKGFSFEVSGVNIPMNVDAAPIVAALGEPASKFEAASCAFQGLDKIFSYNSFEINTYPNGDKDYISSVYFMDDSITTDKGIYLGSSLEDVITAYGEDYTEKSGEYTYTLEQTKLSFIIEEDSVTSITYSAIVEGLNN